MKISLILLIALILNGCNSGLEQKQNSKQAKTSEAESLDFPTKANFSETDSIKELKRYLAEEIKKHQSQKTICAWTQFELESIKYKVGNVYTSKVFMTSNLLHKPFNVSPKMKFRFEDEKEYPFSNLFVKGDTGYVYFIINDDTLKTGEKKTREWRVQIYLPLPEKDTVFSIKSKFTYTK